MLRMPDLKFQMVFDSVKSDPRWNALLKRVGT